MKIKLRSVLDIEIIIMLFLCWWIYLLYQANNTHESLIINWWYLYRDLDLSKSADQEAYKNLINDRNEILKFQTENSTALNRFFETIKEDIKKECHDFWEDFYSMTWSIEERNACVSNYISLLYWKLKTEKWNQRTEYFGKDPILNSYYNDLKGNHPFITYFLDFYDYINTHNSSEFPLPEIPFNEAKGTEDREKYENDFLNKEEKFYTYWWGNINIFWDETAVITNTDFWIVVKEETLNRIKKNYWFNFPYWPLSIAHWTAPIHGPFILHQTFQDNEYFYQIYQGWAWSWEFYLLVWMLKEKLWIPIGYCWYFLYPSDPQLFWTCENRKNWDTLTVLTQEFNLYERNDTNSMAEIVVNSMKDLESIRVLTH